MSSSYRMELDRWLSQLDVRANKVLDIGGSQLSVKGRTKTWDVKEYVIADLPNPHVGSPKPDIEIDLNREMYIGNRADSVLSMMLNYNGKTDLIFCLEVFEYIYDPMQAFTNIADILSIGGIAWITFPSFYPLHQPIEDDALRYMPSGIKKLASAAGLEIIQMIKRRPETNALQQSWSMERMRPAKGEDHSFTGFIVEFRKKDN